MDPADFALLVSLHALLQEGSVTGAARRAGVSTPAMSHALARIRERLGDPILVRSGRGMRFTPRGQALEEPVRQAIEAARRALAPPLPFDPKELERTFVIHASDYVLTILGSAVDGILRQVAPRVCVRFVPNTSDDAALLRDKGSDLAIGIYGELPQEMRSQTLLTDRFVCVMGRGHPLARRPLTLEGYVAARHVQVAPRGKPGGYIDDALREQGATRVVSRAVPYFSTALQLASETDCVVTISERIARRFAESFSLAVLEVPLELRPYALSLVWHPRVDEDLGHRLLRDSFRRAAASSAADRHPAPRTRLDASDPTSGQSRRRPRALR